MVWDSAGATRATRVLIPLAGPLATLALAGCVLTLGAPAAAPAERLLLFTGAAGLLPLIPGSDGARAWAPLRRPAPAASPRTA
jgi:hypothetical protein